MAIVIDHEVVAVKEVDRARPRGAPLAIRKRV